MIALVVATLVLIGFFGLVAFFPKCKLSNRSCTNSVCKTTTDSAKQKQAMPVVHGIIAPELVGIRTWINSAPLTLKELYGKVVLVDFWTYSCINCIRTLPHVQRWHEQYKNHGLVIIGVHAPEFEFEKNVNNIQDAIKHFGITYPVAVDSDYQTWQAYSNRYWPAHYLVDQHGIIRESHFGEGNYFETENAIRKLLGLSPLEEEAAREVRKKITPETYLGYQRGHDYHSELSIKQDEIAHYDYKNSLGDDQVGLKGDWFIGSQYIQAGGDDCTLDLNFIATRVHLVMESLTSQVIEVLLDDKLISSNYYTKDVNEHGNVCVCEARMYDVIDLKNDYGRHKLTLRVPKGVKIYVFTFGE